MNSTRGAIAACIACICSLLVAAPTFAGTDDGSYSRLTTGEVASQAWWVELGDPALSNLIDEALSANPDMVIQHARIDQARSAAWQSLAPVLPQISVELSGRETAIEALGSGTIDQMEMAGENVPDSYRNGSAFLVGQLNVDLFGRNILNHIGSRRDVLASQHNRDTQALSLATTIARTYYEILAGQERTDAVQTQIRANENLLELLQLRYERGDAQGLDVLQQKQQLATTATLLPQVEALYEAAKIQLSVLLGKSPLDPVEVSQVAIPEFSAVTLLGQPSDLVTNRPDLRAAELTYKAETARKNSAIVTFLPSLQLYGQAGEQATYINETEQEFVWEVGASISIPIFQGGGNIAGYRQARAAQVVAESERDRATLEAIAEVENALVQQDQALSQIKAYRAQREAASQAFEQSKSRYLSGLTDFQSVLTALNTQQQAELNMIEAKVNLVDARISLLSSVGGSWTQDISSVEKRNQ